MTRRYNPTATPRTPRSVITGRRASGSAVRPDSCGADEPPRGITGLAGLGPAGFDTVAHSRLFQETGCNATQRIGICKDTAGILDPLGQRLRAAPAGAPPAAARPRRGLRADLRVHPPWRANAACRPVDPGSHAGMSRTSAIRRDRLDLSKGCGKKVPRRIPAPGIAGGGCGRPIVPGMAMLPARREHLMDVSPGRRAGSLSGAGPARMVGCPACLPLEFYSPQKCR